MGKPGSLKFLYSVDYPDQSQNLMGSYIVGQKSSSHSFQEDPTSTPLSLMIDDINVRQ